MKNKNKTFYLICKGNFYFEYIISIITKVYFILRFGGIYLLFNQVHHKKYTYKNALTQTNANFLKFNFR